MTRAIWWWLYACHQSVAERLVQEMSFNWSSKVVLITGAASGVGRALAIELGRRGAAIGLLDRQIALLSEVVDEVEGAGGRALAVSADLKEFGEVRAAADSVRACWGRVDVLVVNAGVRTSTPATDLQVEVVREIIAINSIGAFNSVAAVLPEMIKSKRGHLVAISSMAALRGLPHSGAYSASKAALSTFFESLRVDLLHTGIRVTIIHPGFIKTPLSDKRQMQMPFLVELDEATQRIVRSIEARRRSYSFPWQLASLMRLLTLVPDRLSDYILTKISLRK